MYKGKFNSKNNFLLAKLCGQGEVIIEVGWNRSADEKYNI